MKRILSLTLLVIAITIVPAISQPQEVEMADGMRAEGKIYVVVAIVLLILLGMIGYLISIDRKATRLEEKFRENRQSNA